MEQQVRQGTQEVKPERSQSASQRGTSLITPQQQPRRTAVEDKEDRGEGTRTSTRRRIRRRRRWSLKQYRAGRESKTKKKDTPNSLVKSSTGDQPRQNVLWKNIDFSKWFNISGRRRAAECGGLTFSPCGKMSCCETAQRLLD